MRCRVEWEERNRLGKGKKRGRDGRRNGKTIRVLRRCEKLAVFSELAYLLKLEMEKKNTTFGSVYEDFGLLQRVFVFFFSDHLPLLS